jgi:hypothetical protein
VRFTANGIAVVLLVIAVGGIATLPRI